MNALTNMSLAALVFGVLNVSTAWACDPLGCLMGGHDQDLLVLGEVHVDKQKTRVLVGTVFPQTTARGIHANDLVSFTASGTTLKNGSTYLLSLRRSGTGYLLAWGATEVLGESLADARLVKIKNADDAALQEFIRSGGTEKDFFFDGEKGFVRRGGVPMQIYPPTDVQPDAMDIARFEGFMFWLVTSGVGFIVLLASLLIWRKSL